VHLSGSEQFRFASAEKFALLGSGGLLLAWDRFDLGVDLQFTRFIDADRSLSDRGLLGYCAWRIGDIEKSVQ